MKIGAAVTNRDSGSHLRLEGGNSGEHGVVGCKVDVGPVFDISSVGSDVFAIGNKRKWVGKRLSQRCILHEFLALTDDIDGFGRKHNSGVDFGTSASLVLVP
jgi:hypothetical protein